MCKEFDLAKKAGKKKQVGEMSNFGGVGPDWENFMTYCRVLMPRRGNNKKERGNREDTSWLWWDFGQFEKRTSRKKKNMPKWDHKWGLLTPFDGIRLLNTSILLVR